MAKSVIINGVTYENVPYVNIPMSGTGGGNAKFVDTDSGDAVAGDIRSGKKAWVDGAEITGTIPVRTDSSVVIAQNHVGVQAGLYDEGIDKVIPDAAVNVTAIATGDEIGDTVTDYSIIFGGMVTTTTPGYISGTKSGNGITKYIQVQEKTATPSETAQDITPSAGKLLKKVHVNAVSLTGNASASDVLAGKTFYNTSLSPVTGTATVPIVSQDSTTKVLTIS